MHSLAEQEKNSEKRKNWSGIINFRVCVLACTYSTCYKVILYFRRKFQFSQCLLVLISKVPYFYAFLFLLQWNKFSSLSFSSLMHILCFFLHQDSLLDVLLVLYSSIRPLLFLSKIELFWIWLPLSCKKVRNKLLQCKMILKLNTACFEILENNGQLFNFSRDLHNKINFTTTNF